MSMKTVSKVVLFLFSSLLYKVPTVTAIPTPVGVPVPSPVSVPVPSPIGVPVPVPFPIGIPVGNPNPSPRSVNPCPSEWTYDADNDNCYWVKQTYSWDECSSVCEYNNAQMLCLENIDTISVIITLMTENFPEADRIILGLTDPVNYIWRDGCALVLTPVDPENGNRRRLLSEGNCGFFSRSQTAVFGSCTERLSTSLCACEIAASDVSLLPVFAPRISVFNSPTYTPLNAFAFNVRVEETESVYTWGEAAYGGNATEYNLESGIKNIVSARYGFAALNSTGGVIAWGSPSSVEGLSSMPENLNYLVANEESYVGVQTSPVTIKAFGSRLSGGIFPSDLQQYLGVGVASVVATAGAFAAVSNDGEVFTWGNAHCGAGPNSLNTLSLTGIKFVAATREAFAAVSSTGAVYTWGGKYTGGDSSSVASNLTSGVVHVVGSRTVFAAFKNDSSLVVWGYSRYGGDASAVATSLQSDVDYVAFTHYAVAALKVDGSVVTWGDMESGGNSTGVISQLVNITSITGNARAFAAVTAMNTVVTWGRADYGGVLAEEIATELTDVESIAHTSRAFAALKRDGTVIAWGAPGFGGNYAADVSALVGSNATKLCANEVAFSVITSNHEIVAWGHPVSVPVSGVVVSSAGLSPLYNYTCSG
eukprot:CAMPEP_0170361298 /NCGR_PEP_ID=MMETSP0117_2-20130122/3733_1 /TAXON_ID=400756 /ORGANISM="Durinskia baltica, Strain CSIRO CS-38" /LENGTH=648 /DNA_ID=CAMNT_0010615657 /DNA_START=95 /DNA_END=2041 /DNA_ORIENTATION=-